MAALASVRAVARGLFTRTHQASGGPAARRLLAVRMTSSSTSDSSPESSAVSGLEACFSSDATDLTPVTTYLNNQKYNKFMCNRLDFLGSFNRLLSVDEPASAETLLFNFRKSDGLVELHHLNSLLASWSKLGEVGACERIFKDYVRPEFKPDYFTYLCMARVYGKTNSAEKLSKLAQDMAKEGLDAKKLSSFSLLSDSERDQLHSLVPDVFPASKDVPKPAQLAFSERLEEQWRREANITVLLDAVLTKSELQRLEQEKAKKTSEDGAQNNPEHLTLKKPQYVFEIWKEPLVKFLEAEKEKFLQSTKTLKSKDERTYMYGSVPIEDLADITLTEIERSILSNEFGARVNHLSSDIGRNVFKRYFIVENHKRGMNVHLKNLYAEYENYFKDPTLQKKYTQTQYWKELEKRQGDNILGINEENIEPWTIQIILQVGASLINAVLNSASISKVPGYSGPDTAAFYHTYEYEGAKQIGHIRAHDFVHTLATVNGPKSNGEVITKRAYDALTLPTLIPPRPWTSVRTGAYLLTPSNIMRCADDAFQHLALLANVNDSLNEVFDALNYLSSCPWVINRKVYDVVRHLFVSEEGHEDLEINPLNVPMPKKPEKDAMDQYYNLYRLAKQQCKDNLSQRSDLTLKVTIAENFKDQVFYFPHNMDFRGRAYTIPPHLNHLGMDLCRGLLKFGEKRPLGKRGLYWLKIHLANVYGQDKLSFDDRVKFAENNMDNILDSADNPLGNPPGSDHTKWWRKGESPWQVLAVCCEIADAIRSGNPETFESNLPVHQDGTCNGLQHYAALGRDKEGAHHVNLDGQPDSDKPQDVYTAVAKRVTALVQMHANGDFTIPVPIGRFTKKEKQQFAQMLLAQGPIPRKVVKQTVMTTVYGVTMIGARDQILKQLKAQGNIPIDVVFDIANYLAKCVFVSLGHIFSSAQKIQTWLSDTASIIASTGDPVTWITPMGLPIVQPYHTARRKHLSTKLQSITISNSSSILLAPKVAKQKNAFPPNFVHSLDSTHMMYTANACKAEGITFVAVHDSFWTHAATVDIMNVHTREQFVRLHSQPLLENLYQYYKRNYDGLKYKKANKVGEKPVVIEHYPELGTFDIKEVLNSKYFFN